MSLRKFGLAVAITTVAMFSAITLNEPASAGRRSSGYHGHHEHHGHYGHYGLKKQCFRTYHGVRCYYVKSR
jgi:hypothetical protein